MPKAMLDAGHYGNQNQSPIYPQYYEAKQMWKLHLLLQKYLEQYGFEVDTTRPKQEKDLSLQKRGESAKGYDLFISLHSDACDTESVDRATAFYAHDDWNNASELAQKLADAVGKCMGVPGKVKTRQSTKGKWDYYSVMFYARKVGCPMYYIMEHSFHTNEASAKWLMSDSNLDKLARAEAKVIAEHFGLAITKSDFDIGFRLLKNGMSGEDVRAYQYALKGRGIKGANGEEIIPDGKFGKNTEHATKTLQKQFGLKEDGKAGEQTLTAAYGGTA